MRWSQVLSPKLIIPDGRFWRSKAMRCAGGHPDHIIGDLQELRDLVTGDVQGAPFARELEQYLSNEFPVGWINTGEWLISNQAPRRADPCQRDFGTAPFPARKLQRALIQPSTQLEPLNDPRRTLGSKVPLRSLDLLAEREAR
jgi:hypothetical protein